jgi:Tetratricopeptide repeat
LESAADWLRRPELVATGSPWAAGARYNLARTYESQGMFDEAIALYEQGESPQQHGNRLRAKWLASRPKEAESSGTP